jgi:hypothetical protein
MDNEVNEVDEVGALTIDGAIEELKIKQQERLNVIANADPVYCNIAGQIHALTAVKNKDVE